MLKRFISIVLLASIASLSGCASVPMESAEKDQELKQFAAPKNDKAGVYIYRNTFGGQALKKDLYIDGNRIGETANKVYFHKLLDAGKHTFSTESEFSNNNLVIELKAGINYFIEQYIKMGVFVGGANLKQVDEAEGKKQVLATKLAKEMP